MAPPFKSEWLGHISKAGNRYLRSLFVVGALSVIRRAEQTGSTRRGRHAKSERRSTKLAVIAPATDIPIPAGETLYDVRMFRDFMAAGALGLAQPDVLKLGGIGCWMEVAALARTHGLPVVPAGFNPMQIDAHLMAAIPHGLFMEHIPWLGPIFERPVRIEDGFALVPREPGIGTDIRAEAIERHGVAWAPYCPTRSRHPEGIERG